MSQVRRIGVEVYGNVAGYIGATNRVIYGTTRMAQGFKSAIGTSRILDNQVKALSTTFRYALAGSVVFGITGALSRLQDFQNELGTIDSLAGKLNAQGKFQGLGKQLQDIGSEAIKMSDKYGQSVTDIESYMARFYSTFDPKGNLKNRTREMEGFVNEILRLQTALGSEAGDPSALAAGIGGLVNVIPGGRSNIAGTTKRVANLVAYLTQVTPNVTGGDVSNAAGRLASIYNVANMSPEQLFAVFGQAAKVGGTPTIVTRGVTQLLGASLLNPKSPGNIAGYQAAGLSTNPTVLRQMGGMKVLERLLEAVAPSGLRLSRNQLRGINQGTPGSVYTNPALQGLNLKLLYQLFGRQQSVQQFVNILSQDGVRGLQNYLKAQEQATKADLNRQRADQALHSRGMQIASNAFSNISLSLVRGLNAPMTVFGKLIQKASDEMAGHRTTTSVVESTGAALVTSRLIARLPMFQKIGAGWAKDAEKISAGEMSLGLGTRVFRGMAGKVAGLGKLQSAVARSAIMAEETGAVASGALADGSRANPFWVIISPWTQYVGYPGGDPNRKPSSPVDKIVKDAAKIGGGGGVAGLAARLGLGGAMGGDVALGLTGVGLPIAALGAAVYLTRNQKGSGQLSPWMKYRQTHKQFVPGHAFDMTRPATDMYGYPIGGILGGAKMPVRVHGKANADVTVRLVDKHGNDIVAPKKVGVPIELTNDTAPHSQGRAGVRKGN